MAKILIALVKIAFETFAYVGALEITHVFV